jgi:YD repeat-containing protein
LEKRWRYDDRGNVVSEETAPYGATEFTGNAYTYDSDGRYLLTKTDALGHTTTFSGYNKFGKPAASKDYRHRETTYSYDSWGDLISTFYPDGSNEQTTVSWGGVGLYTVTSISTGKPRTITHCDDLGREIKSGVERFDGQWQWVDKEYDSQGCHFLIEESRHLIGTHIRTMNIIARHPSPKLQEKCLPGLMMVRV